MTLTPDYYHDSRPLNLLVTSDDEAFSKAVEEMLVLLDMKGSKLVRACVLVLLVNLVRLQKYRPTHYLYYPRNNNEWTQRGRREARVYNPFGISRKMVDVVDAMVEKGYLLNVQGYNQRDENGRRWSVQSRMQPKPLLITFMEAHGLLDADTHVVRALPVIRLCDDDKQIIHGILPKRLPKDVRESESFINQYNTFLAQQDVEIDADGHGCFLDETSVYRVFNKRSWTLGGRFAGAWWMSCGREYRRHIHINGEPCVELDYMAQHFNLLYALRGISLPKDDPYQIQDFRRDFIKAVCLRLVNADSIEQAWKSCRSDGLKDKVAKKVTMLAREVDGCLSSLDMFEHVVDAIKSKHPAIADDLCCEKGLMLMHWDSRICQKVLETMTVAEVPCLSVHDSFLVPESSRDSLMDAMVQAYHDVGLGKGVPSIK